MELNRINIYINEHLWKYFNPNERMPIFLVLQNKEEKHLLSEMTFKDGIVFHKRHSYDKWKMLQILVSDEIKKIFENEKSVSYYIYTEGWRSTGMYTAIFNLEEPVPCFYDFIDVLDWRDTKNLRDLKNPINSKRVRCHSTTLLPDLFIEFFYLPRKWNKYNHYEWPYSLRKDIFNLLLLLKRLKIHKDIKYVIIDILVNSYKKTFDT